MNHAPAGIRPYFGEFKTAVIKEYAQNQALRGQAPAHLVVKVVQDALVVVGAGVGTAGTSAHIKCQ